ncbi:MAG: histidine kinase [Roseivirga sp.]|nr:histidine kinase [Roseivirga sp.]
MERRDQTRQFFKKYWKVFAAFLVLQILFEMARSWSYFITGKNDGVQWDIRITDSVINYALWAVALVFLYKAYMRIRPVSGIKAWLRVLLLVVAAGFLQSLVQHFLYLTIYEFLFGFKEQRPYWTLLSEQMKFFFPFSFIAMGQGFFFVSMIAALDYYEKHRNEKLRSLDLQSQLSKSKLDALQAQLNPHFLFNALNTISMMVRAKKEEKATAMISSLSDLLRTSLQMEATEMITLEQELMVITKYLEIEKERFSDRLTVELDIPEALKSCGVPSLILQPIIENAFKYGVTENLNAALIKVKAHAAGTKLTLTVSNNGTPLPADWAMDENKGIGLSNVQKRLSYMFEDYAFELRNDTNTDEVIATIVIPKTEVV